MYKPLVVTVMIILDEVNMNVGLFLIMHIYMYDEIYGKLCISTCQPQTCNQYLSYTMAAHRVHQQRLSSFIPGSIVAVDR